MKTAYTLAERLCYARAVKTMSAQRAKLFVSLVGGVQCFYFGGLIKFAYCMITIHTANFLNVSMFILAHSGGPWGWVTTGFPC